MQKNSRFYSKLLEEKDEAALCSLEELQQIPSTYPQDVAKNSLDFLCVPQIRIARVITLNTSGTSGTAERIYFTEEDLEDTIDFFRHGISCLTDV